MRTHAFAAILLACAAGVASAQELPELPASNFPVIDRTSTRDLDAVTRIDTTPLELAAILDAIERHPTLAGYDATVEIAEAKHLTAEGAFDTRVGAKASTLPVGYYDPMRLDVVVDQPTTLWGTRFYAGYSLGLGDSPAYEGKKETLNIGELRAGVEVPLWNGGPIDDARAELAITDLEIDRKQALRSAKRLELSYKARVTYAKWLVSGQRLAFAERIQEFAQARFDASERQLELGLTAEIDVVDLRRTLLERQNDVILSQRALQSAALALAFYHRDAAGNPLVPGRDQLPTTWLLPPTPDADTLAGLRELARTQRPEYRAFGERIDQLEVERELFDNKLAPKINLSAEVAQDFGGGPHLSLLNTPKTKGAFELMLGLSVSWTFQQREALGKLRAAEAELDQVDFELQVLDETIALEIQDALVTYQAAIDSLDNARERFEATRALEAAARRKYALGAVDLLTVYQREQSTIKAFDTVLKAWYELHVTAAALNISVGTWTNP